MRQYQRFRCISPSTSMRAKLRRGRATRRTSSTPLQGSRQGRGRHGVLEPHAGCGEKEDRQVPCQSRRLSSASHRHREFHLFQPSASVDEHGVSFVVLSFVGPLSTAKLICVPAGNGILHPAAGGESDTSLPARRRATPESSARRPKLTCSRISSAISFTSAGLRRSTRLWIIVAKFESASSANPTVITICPRPRFITPNCWASVPSDIKLRVLILMTLGPHLLDALCFGAADSLVALRAFSPASASSFGISFILLFFPSFGTLDS
jgi:hypothetical protein